MSNDPFRIVEFKDAGKDKFNELLSVRAFLRKHKVRTRDDEWYVWDKKAWVRRSRSMYLPDAIELLPQAVRGLIPSDQSASNPRRARI